MLDNFYKAATKSTALSNNPYLMSLYRDAYKVFKDFLKKHGAPVQTENYEMGMKIIETVLDAKKIDIPKSMMKPPAGYKELKTPGGFPMMPMTPPGGSR